MLRWRIEAWRFWENCCPKKQSLFSGLEGKPLVEKEEYESVVQSRDALSGKVRKIIALDKEIAENQGKIQKLEVQAEGLAPGCR